MSDYVAPKYPKLPPELDKRRKLSLDDIKEMKEWRERGKSYQWIGDTFGVSRTTAHYHTDDAFRVRTNKQRYKRLKKSYEDDPELLARKRKASNASFTEKTKLLSEFKEFKAKHTYLWKKKRYHADPEFQEITLSQARAKYYRDKQLKEDAMKGSSNV